MIEYEKKCNTIGAQWMVAVLATVNIIAKRMNQFLFI